MSGVEKVKKWIEENGLDWKIHMLQSQVKTVAQAASALGVPKSVIVKTIVLVDDSRTIACIIPGDKRLSLGKVKSITGGSPRLAKPNEVLERTGYRIGGVPPYPLPGDVVIIMDERVLDNEKVYGGGGDERSLLEFSPRELLSIARVIVADIVS
ncbi:MAG: YbaK/EbsC family protein [Desulfurococcales archaeon]|nr:YbaK/EbsC family protein [Desulfurococcales archaeon]